MTVTARPTPGPLLRGRKPRLAPEDRYPLKWAHEYLAETWPAPTFPVDRRAGIVNLGMMGNDQWTDCVEAAKAHYDMVTGQAAIDSGVTGVTVLSPDSPQAVDDFMWATGETTPPGDGTSIPEYLQKCFKAGKIKAWAPVNHADRSTCIALMALGFSLLIGGNLYPSSESQFNGGVPFQPASESPDPDDGHAVLWSYAQGLTDGFDQVGTWAVFYPANVAWMRGFLHDNPDGEAYLVVTTDEQMAKFTPDLLADVQALGGGEGGVPTPTPSPVPAPAPEPAPAPVVTPPVPPVPGPVEPPPPHDPPTDPTWEDRLEELVDDFTNSFRRILNHIAGK